MLKINSGLIASGKTQPEILPGDKWEDKIGLPIIIESYRFNRVTFYRDGYGYPCIYPEQRFIKEFQPVKDNKQ
ncbi:DUF4222 domain-containing protein [Klebsiella pneumoniae]|uniref:DUF4222 domain-containing protein n=1 Tax=Klebsiella pneumoniae complex TaxID=3390273 RepID=UPI000430D060|nr:MULTISPECIES: DUF4222 domain-containing protein [Klebsiella]UWI36124.1 MAG: protein of unknown function DUF4222 [Bacteriophage sp.]HCB1001050.1 DUF4222 domain-containing protein [Klebsiella variicola subsp. variicola]HCM5755852.1 DUF4222 domain-containing protein [Klebsiella quasipneumoniae]MCF7154184.1 DUF4222 domain-containing protein [Klebsiella pneumoniae]MDV0652935.1 DUF4222 domain-containing protein [Klebsiella quasipneumoniae subsp. similipneumoniae]